MKPTKLTPLPWEGKGEALMSAAKSVSAPASVTFGPKSSVPLSRSELLSWLRSDLPHVSRKIEYIVLHCSDTRPSTDYTIERLTRDHKREGFGDYPGYHLYLRRNGHLYYCRPLALKGCHVVGHNANSIGICTEGGHREDAPPLVHKYEDNRTAEQLVVLHDLLTCLHAMFPSAKILGHRDFPGVKKACPCYDAAKEYAYINDL